MARSCFQGGSNVPGLGYQFTHYAWRASRFLSSLRWCPAIDFSARNMTEAKAMDLLIKGIVELPAL